jgi:transcriptional regulator with XRE-family HTH domain
VSESPHTRALKKTRHERGLTQRELAFFSGCHHVTISRLEAGDIDVSAALKARIARALGVSVERLWAPVDNAKPDEAA